MQKKKSLNPIPPTLRGKKRYILFELVSDQSLIEIEVKKGIWSVFGNIFGGKGIADQKLWLVKWYKNHGILRCSLKEEENVKAGLLFLKQIKETPVIPIISKVSGSIKKLTA